LYRRLGKAPGPVWMGAENLAIEMSTRNISLGIKAAGA
jgi:hypothetical protein